MIIKRVHIADIKSDGRYQRNINVTIVRDIINNFDEEALSLITLVNRGTDEKPEYYCIDGQHRIIALLEIGEKYKEHPFVYANICKTKNEAELFLRLNTKRRVPDALELFKAKVFSGDEKSIKTKETIESVGYLIPTTKTTANNALTCIPTLNSIIKEHGHGGLKRTLEHLKYIYGYDSKANQSCIIKGLSHIIYNSNVDVDILCEKLKNISLQRLKSEMDAKKMTYNKSPYLCMAIAMLEIYNKSKKNKATMDL